jgi:hypothetical protein
VIITVVELAQAQGINGEFAELIRLRQGLGVRSPWDLLFLTAQVRKSLFGDAAEDLASLNRCLRSLERMVDDAPAGESDLLRYTFNCGGDHLNEGWDGRLLASVASTDPSVPVAVQQERADLALLKMIMRTRPAAEAVPEPPGSSTVLQIHAAEPVTALAFFREDYVRNSSVFQDAWRGAERVEMLGFAHNRMVVSYSAEIATVLRNGGRVRVLLQDPDGAAVLEANTRSSTPKAADEAVRHQHRAGIVTLLAISDSVGARPEALQIRAFDLMPPFTAYFFDSHKDTGVAFVWFWSWRQSSSWRPGFRLAKSGDEVWFARFLSQFEGLWSFSEGANVR